MQSPSHIYCDKQRIDINTIIWLEGDWNYTRIYQEFQLISLSAYTLKWYEQQLADFVRVRKNAIVNPQHVCEVLPVSSRPRRLKIIMSNGEQLEVTRRRQALARKRLGKSYYSITDTTT